MSFVVNGKRAGKVEGKREYDKNFNNLNIELNKKISDLNKKIIFEIEQRDQGSIRYNETRFNDYKKLTYSPDGLLEIASILFKKFPLLGKIVGDKFDYIFIDEYQDTSEKIVDLFLRSVYRPGKVIGLFGDSMQSIYGDGIGNVNKYVDEGVLKRIDKEDNYRCSEQIIKFINSLRNDGLSQELALKRVGDVLESRDSRQGAVEFYYAFYDEKPNSRATDVGEYRAALNLLIEKSNFPSVSKTLVLSNSAVSTKAGFADLFEIFSARYLDPREEITNVLTRLQLLDLFEICDAHTKGDFNFILMRLKKAGLSLKNVKQKITINENILNIINSNYSALQALEKAFEYEILKETDSFLEYKNRAEAFLVQAENDEEFKKFEADYIDNGNTLTRMLVKYPDFDEDDFLEQEKNIKKRDFFKEILSEKLKFSEVCEYFRYEDERTQYITMHKTKGTGIENVLVVLDEYFWIEYDFRSAFDLGEVSTAKKLKSLQLIYVACSRAKKNLRCVRLVSREEAPLFLAAFKNHFVKEIDLGIEKIAT
jgi:DNA helicase-2/ATP-dependent DNA helicase PcrA